MAVSCNQFFVIFPPSPRILERIPNNEGSKKSALFVNIMVPLQAHSYRICMLEGRIQISFVSPTRKCVPREPSWVTVSKN